MLYGCKRNEDYSKEDRLKAGLRHVIKIFGLIWSKLKNYYWQYNQTIYSICII